MNELKDIITNGKLKTYSFGGGFVKVYWYSDDLPKGTYWLFRFIESQQKFVDVTKVKTAYIPIKYKARKYNSSMESLVMSLIE